MQQATPESIVNFIKYAAPRIEYIADLTPGSLEGVEKNAGWARAAKLGLGAAGLGGAGLAGHAMGSSSGKKTGFGEGAFETTKYFNDQMQNSGGKSWWARLMDLLMGRSAMDSKSAISGMPDTLKSPIADVAKRYMVNAGGSTSAAPTPAVPAKTYTLPPTQ